MCDRNESPNNQNNKSTPTNRKIRNPFDRVLIEKLHNPICSPGMCKIYKKKGNGSFRWDIDQACTLVPAEIVPCNSQFEPSPDPVLERIAEEANERFFSQEMVMPSPHESSKKVKPLFITSDSLHITTFDKQTVVMKDVSAQTVLTLPPELPPELEKILEPFCTFTQEQNISGDYEITANGSLRRKLFFEEHSDHEHSDSEQTDDENHSDPRPAPSYETHSPVTFSPDMCHEFVGKGMKRTFGTPVNMASTKPYRNKILDIEPCFSPIEFRTPKRDKGSTTSSSLASTSISPVTKAVSSDEEKNNFTSPESDAMATCLDCINECESEKKSPCFCKKTQNKSIIKRSASLKESPPRSRKGSFLVLEKRSLSMSSLHRSKSVQKLDFSMDMSIDGSMHEPLEGEPELSTQQISTDSSSPIWSIVDETSIQHLVKSEILESQTIRSSTKIDTIGSKILDDTPVKSKSRSFNLPKHEISKIRASATSPLHMSLDNSLDTDSSLSLEHKKIDFNTIDLNFLTENASQYEYSQNVTKVGSNNSTSFKKVDSGYNDNTFYMTNASSYYESAIKPSELTITSTTCKLKANTSKTVLKEISNVPWTRVDSGFKDENSVDSNQFYHANESSVKKVQGYRFTEALLENKENIVADDFDQFLGQSSKSMSDIFTDDMTFNCNFSSTPSKNKSRKVHS